jgi:hypothetical protein
MHTCLFLYLLTALRRFPRAVPTDSATASAMLLARADEVIE